MLTIVSSISSETVIIFELPWNPRCVTIMSLNSLAFFTGILAYNSSLCYNITEKVFAIKWVGGQSQPLKWGNADDEVRFFRADYYLRVMYYRFEGMRKAAQGLQA